MNSNYGKGSSGSLNNFQFDFGVGSNRSKPLADQKKQSPSSYSSFSTSYSAANTKPAWQPNKPSWTHQPAQTHQPVTRSELASGPASMVGDIFGKTWTSSSSGSGSGIGIVSKNPNLFGDLVSSAIGLGKTSGNVPLKDATTTQTSHKSPYSMGNLADSLPKTSNTVKTGMNYGSTNNVNVSSSGFNSFSPNANVNNNKSPSLGGPSMKSMASGGSGIGVSSSKDPFGSLVDLSKQSVGRNSGNKKQTKPNTGDDAFGNFQNASKPTTDTTSFQPNGFSSFNNNGYSGSNSSPSPKIDDFGLPAKGFSSQSQPSDQSSIGDPFGMFFSSSSTSAGAPEAATAPEFNDWGLGSEFGGVGDDSGSVTTELEGLPPPPAGVSASTAKTKGVDNQKQGQYADAIKWLSWAVILMDKAGDKTGTMEVLSCRASCYKEVGEYKKAVADCSKVLEHDESNVSALVQRALLYESMEKYRLGAEDLRSVLKIDPGNRIARSTIHRLTKMAD